MLRLPPLPTWQTMERNLEAQKGGARRKHDPHNLVEVNVKHFDTAPCPPDFSNLTSRSYRWRNCRAHPAFVVLKISDNMRDEKHNL